MLRAFIIANRELIIERARQRVRKRMPTTSSEVRLDHGIPIFLTQLADALLVASPGAPCLASADRDRQQAIAATAALHGRELLRNGFTVGQVVHGYGDVCQIVTELASETNSAISATDFHMFNLCLDGAIAGAVTAYGQHRENDLVSEGVEQKGMLAHELRNLLHAATLSFDVIKRGAVGVGGSTGAIHARSLAGLTTSVERALAEVRLESGLRQLQPLLLVEFIEEVARVARMQAEACGVDLSVTAVSDGDLAINADRQLLASAVLNLLQNALKFTHAGGMVSLVARCTGDRVLIEVSDKCGGLPDGKGGGTLSPIHAGRHGPVGARPGPVNRACRRALEFGLAQCSRRAGHWLRVHDRSPEVSCPTEFRGAADAARCAEHNQGRRGRLANKHGRVARFESASRSSTSLDRDARSRGYFLSRRRDMSSRPCALLIVARCSCRGLQLTVKEPNRRRRASPTQLTKARPENEGAQARPRLSSC